MQGNIYNINWQQGIVAVLTESENFSIFEILSDDNIEIGDEVFWTENHPLGDCEIKNISKDETIQVYFQNHWIEEKKLRKWKL